MTQAQVFTMTSSPRPEKDENIKVLVRIRPPSSVELTSGYHKAVRVNEDGRSVSLNGDLDLSSSSLASNVLSGQQNKSFVYDSVVDENSSQETVFSLVGKPIADAFLKGYHSNLLAYGQTGAGKTYTMQGPSDLESVGQHELGLLPRVLQYVFHDLDNKKKAHEAKGLSYEYSASVSHLEIYNEVIFDLLDPEEEKNITVREDGKRGVKVDGAAVEKVANAEEAYALFKSGSESRHVGSTAANRESSRSHSVFVLSVEQKFSEGATGLEKKLSASFYLVDLAGSERQKHSEAVGQTLKEACGINKSLSTLGNVIKSLVDIADGKERHIPYRDSKLTFLLKNSFGGMSKCSFVANISPSLSALEETLSTLKFAQRAKIVKNTSSVCEETIGNNAALQMELKKVKAELLRLQQEGPQMSRGNLLQNLDEEEKGHLEAVRQLLTSERAAQANEREKLTEQNEALQGLAKKLETSLKSTKLVVRLREQSLQRLQSKMPPVPSEFWEEQGGVAIKENEQLKVQLECHPEIVKCRMEVESLQKENGKLKRKLETDVESQIFVFQENAKTAMEELHYLLKEREDLQSNHQTLNHQYNQLKEENFIDLKDAHEKLEAAFKSNESLEQDNLKVAKECDCLQKEISSLKGTLSVQSDTIRRSQAALEEVQSHLLIHSELCEQLNDQVTSLTGDLESMEEQKSQVESSLETLKSDMDSQKQAHAQECEQLNDLMSKLEETQNALSETTDERDELGRKAAKLEMDHKLEMDNAQEEINKLQSLVESLTMKTAKIESEESAVLEKLSTLEKEMIEKEQLMAGSEEKRKEMELSKIDLEQNVMELEEKCQELENELSEVNKYNSDQVEELRAELESASSKYQKLEAKNKEVVDSMSAQIEEDKNSKDELQQTLQSRISDLTRIVETLHEEKAQLETAVASSENDALALKKYEEKISGLESALQKAQQNETELRLKSRESLNSCNTAMEEIAKLSTESNSLKVAEEELQLKLSAANDELARFRQLYSESQNERKALEKEKGDLQSQVDVEAEKRQNAIMAKVQSESKLSEVQEEAVELRNDLQEQLRMQRGEAEHLRKKVFDLESRMARSQSPLTPMNDENKPSRFKLGSAQRRPFGELSNKIKSIELTPTNKSKAADKSKQLSQVKAHLSAIESAITSRNHSRYALRTRNRVTSYKE